MRNEWNRDEEKSPVTFVLQVRESAPSLKLVTVVNP